MTKPTLPGGLLHFFWAGLVRHAQTGSFLPSQRFLVDAMIAPVPRDYEGKILELGTGTGPLTLRLAAKCPKARIVGCEINPVLAQHTRQNLARAGIDGQVQVLTAPAQELLLKAGNGGEKAGFVISGVPLGNLGREAVLQLLASSNEALEPDGMFIQAQHFLIDRRRIRDAFSSLRTVPVLLNVPPVFVYYATK